jgi:hypothetical protein
MATLLDEGDFTRKSNSVERLPHRDCVLVRYTCWKLANRLCTDAYTGNRTSS